MGRKVLISPLGMSPGSVISAIGFTNPDLVIVLGSEASLKALPEIVAKTEFPWDRLRIFSLEDPLDGYGEGLDRAQEVINYLTRDDQVAS